MNTLVFSKPKLWVEIFSAHFFYNESYFVVKNHLYCVFFYFF